MRVLAEAEWRRVAALRHARVTSAITVEIGRVGGAAQTLLRVVVTAILLTVQLALTILVSWRIGLVAFVILVGGSLAALVASPAEHGSFGTFTRNIIAPLYWSKLRRGGETSVPAYPHRLAAYQIA